MTGKSLLRSIWTIPVAVSLFCGLCPAVHWKVMQITDNDYHDRGPLVISQGWVVWTAEVGGADNEIMLYGGTTPSIRRITNNNCEDGHPGICWDHAEGKVFLCWHADSGPHGTKEIYTLGAKVPLRLTDNDFDDVDPVCSFARIAWEGQHNNADWEIYIYSATSGVRRLTANSDDDRNPCLSGPNVAWFRHVPVYGQDVYFFDGFTTTRLTADSNMETWGQIDGDHFVWGVFHGAGTVGDWEIHHYDDSHGTLEQLTENDFADKNPMVSEGRIAWEVYQGDDHEVMYYDGQDIRQLTYNASDDEDVRLSGARVAWVRFPRPGTSTHDGQILVFDDADESITLLEDGFDDAYRPSLAGDYVAWQVWDGHDYEIMLAVACNEMPGDANRDCEVNLLDLAEVAADWTRCTAPSKYCSD